MTTASMAPTLLGLHRQAVCKGCGADFAVDAAHEVDADGRPRARAQAAGAGCPHCGHETVWEGASAGIPEVVAGDRLLVDKAAYAWREPARWEVVVFRDPTAARQRLVKRVVGLPGETVRIEGGEIWIRRVGQSEFRIAAKPPEVARRMWIPIADSRWTRREGSGKRVETPDPGEHWAYEHRVETTRRFSDPRLITDALGYNAWRTLESPQAQDASGLHFAGDLALRVEFDGAATSREAAIELRLTQRSHEARLSFLPGQGSVRAIVSRGGGDDEVRSLPIDAGRERSATLALIDGQVHAWWGEKLLDFDPPLRLWDELGDRAPDERDLRPAGFRAEGVAVTRWSLFRDVYYTALDRESPATTDFVEPPSEIVTGGREYLERPERMREVFAPRNRRVAQFTLADDEYLMLGDNSPRSIDSRRWPARPGVPRRLIVGRALGE